jgi:hypothetical protein
VDVREDELPPGRTDQARFFVNDGPAFHPHHPEGTGAVPAVVRRLEVDCEKGARERVVRSAVPLQEDTP